MKKKIAIDYFDVVPFMKQKQIRKKRKERDKKQEPKESKKKDKQEEKGQEQERDRKREIEKGGGQKRPRRNKGRHSKMPFSRWKTVKWRRWCDPWWTMSL